MKISEVFEQANILHDDKARRVLNTAPDTYANISIQELDNGVTIEQLEKLNVPVYQYGTQITIHGIFKDIPDNFRVCGYKSIILNQNQSLGVKYCAIDAKKKKLMNDAARFVESSKRWLINIDSQSCMVFKTFSDKQNAIDCYKSTPDNLYIGHKEICGLVYGGYAVIMYIGAIYQHNLWELINTLFGIANAKQLGTLILERKRLWESERIKWQNEAKQREIERNAQIEQARQSFTVPNNWIPFNGSVTEPGIYAQITTSFMRDNPVLFVYKISKFGNKLKINSKSFEDFKYVDWIPGKSHITESKTINGYRIIEQTAPKPIETKIEPIKTDGKVSINHNEKLNGIEVTFDAKPQQSVLDTLKNLGFRWSQYNKLWYAKYTESLLNEVKQNILDTVSV